MSLYSPFVESSYHEPTELLLRTSDEHEGFRKLARSVLEQAVSDAKLVKPNQTTHKLEPCRGYTVNSHVAKARAFLCDPVRLKLWCDWIGADEEGIARASRRMVWEAERREARA